MKLSVRARLGAALMVSMLALSSPSSALPTLGSVRPPAWVVDSNDNVFYLTGVKNRPMLVLYEDKASSSLNAAFKDDLSKLARGDRYRTRVALVPVADVEGYDYWPVRGFVKDAIRDESRKVGATIYCDWDGSFRRAMGIRRGTSTVILFGSDGRVRFARAGGLTPPERRHLLDLLRAEVDRQT